MDDHVMHIIEGFVGRDVGVGCSCGWESSDLWDGSQVEAYERATDAWENHCDVVFMDATTAGDADA